MELFDVPKTLERASEKDLIYLQEDFPREPRSKTYSKQKMSSV